MRLSLYSSRAGDASPNLVAIQSPALDMLPTVLVCPFQPSAALTDLRVAATWQGKNYTVLCDLARPINRKTLRRVGELDAATSQRIIETFVSLLAL